MKAGIHLSQSEQEERILELEKALDIEINSRYSKRIIKVKEEGVSRSWNWKLYHYRQEWKTCMFATWFNTVYES